MQENQKKIEEFDRKHPPVNKSLSEAVIDKVMEEILNPLINKLPVSKDLKDLARSGVRKGLEKGSEAACDAAIDGTGASGPEAEGLEGRLQGGVEDQTGRSVAMTRSAYCHTLARSSQVQGAGRDGGAQRAQLLRLRGPALKSIKLDAEMDGRRG